MDRMKVLVAAFLSSLCKLFGVSIHRLVLMQHLRDRMHQYHGTVRLIEEALWGDERAKQQLKEIEACIPEHYKRRPEYEFQDPF